MDCAAHHALHDPCALFYFFIFIFFRFGQKPPNPKYVARAKRKEESSGDRRQTWPPPLQYSVSPQKGVGVPLPPHRGETSGEGYSSRPTLPRWGPNDRKQCRARLSSPPLTQQRFLALGTPKIRSNKVQPSDYLEAVLQIAKTL